MTNPADLPAAGARPLDGLVVIDLTAAWAGPMTTRSLAYLGATVVKIESPLAMDPWRGTVRGATRDRFPDFEPGPRPYNRNANFNTQNHDKLSIALNLKVPEAVDLVREMARRADIVIANFSPGVLDRLGIGYAALQPENPSIIVIEMPAFGVGGPMTRHVGMGMTMEAAAGMTSLMGYGDGVPVPTGTAFLDPVGGLNGLAAVMTALVERSRTGVGQHIELAQTEAAMHFIGEEIIATAEGGRPWTPNGNRVRDAAPHDAFPCVGEDEWVAIAAFDDAQWRALCAVAGLSDLAASPEFRTLAARLTRQDELYDRIAEWTRQVDKFDAADRLQGAGVPAAPVMNGRDIHEDADLRDLGFVTRLAHPDAGEHDYPGLAYRLARTPGRMVTAAPRFAEHNDVALSTIFGIDEERRAALRAAGALADLPDGAGPEGELND